MHANLTEHCAFGKLQRSLDDAHLTWHPLIHHLADVAAVFEALCKCRNIRRALETAAKRELSAQDIARLAVLVFLHDFGKVNTGFQAKRWPDGQRPRGRLTAGHGTEALALLEAASYSEEAEALLLQLPIMEICSGGARNT